MKKHLPVLLFSSVLVLLSCQLEAKRPTPQAPATQVTASFGTVTKITPLAANTLATTANDWYKDQVFYHVWVKSFRDSNSDGVGDLNGITSKLDYLHDLGVTALWLSPIFQNASTLPNLHGYDTTDYTKIDPRFGSEADLGALLREAHKRDMRVIFDFVPNHVSTQNPWFQDSLKNRNGKQDWFVWRDSRPTQGWSDVGGSGAGSGFHQASNGQYYFGVFWSPNPDLNYRNPEVKTAMANVVIRWLNFGFDGMRVDAVKYLYEDPLTGANTDQPETIAFFQKLRAEIVDGYAAAGAAKFMVAENWTGDTLSLGKYLLSEGEVGFHATLDFPFGWGASSLLNQGEAATSALGNYYNQFVAPTVASGGWTFTFLSNHDNYQSRLKSQYGPDQKVRLAQALQMTAWGTPVLYYGNEVGMTGAAGNDLDLRAPFDWAAVAGASGRVDSPYNWQKTLNRLRADRESLRRGSFTLVPSSAGTVAVVRALGDEATLMVANLGTSTLASVTVDLSGISPLAGLSTLVGDTTNTLSGTTLTLTNLKPEAVRFLALEASGLANRRGDFTDGPPKTTVQAIAKDFQSAGLRVAFFSDQSGTVLLEEKAASYTGTGGYWWANTEYPIDQSSGSLVWKKANGEAVSDLVPIDLSGTDDFVQVGFPPTNTGSSATWYLRGVANDWTAGVPMTAVEGEPGHFSVTLSPAQVSSLTYGFKLNARNDGSWDYFFGFYDLAYDTVRGDSPVDLGYVSSGGDRNLWFRGDGTSSYSIHFLNQKGISQLWINRVTP